MRPNTLVCSSQRLGRHMCSHMCFLYGDLISGSHDCAVNTHIHLPSSLKDDVSNFYLLRCFTILWGMSVNVFLYVSLCAHACICIYIYIYIFICVCVCVCVPVMHLSQLFSPSFLLKEQLSLMPKLTNSLRLSGQ